MVAITALVAYFGWLLPRDPFKTDYFVWDDHYVTEYVKSILARRDVLISGEDVAPLQSQIDINWTVNLVYSQPDA